MLFFTLNADFLKLDDQRTFKCNEVKKYFFITKCNFIQEIFDLNNFLGPDKLRYHTYVKNIFIDFKGGYSFHLFSSK